MTERFGDELKAEQEQQLRALLALLKQHNNTVGFIEPIAAYVIEGTEEVLSKLSGTVIGWQLFNVEYAAPFLAFYRSAHAVPLAVMQRWLRFLTQVFNLTFASSSRFQAPGAPVWLEALLYHQSGSSPSQFGADTAGRLPYGLLEELYRAEGLDPAALVMLPFSQLWKNNYSLQRVASLLGQMPGFVGALVQQQAQVRTHLRVDDLEQRAHFFGLLKAASGEELLNFLPELVASACVNPRSTDLGASLSAALRAACRERASLGAAQRRQARRTCAFAAIGDA